ncbi:hypothetical protein C0J52_03115 [Blattella germanica]|nr:hypothetical protein C0J52_03115 [Blattella germanica]
MKAKRESELAVEKRRRMSTGGGACTPRMNDDPQLDSLIESVDNEMSDDVNNDTLNLLGINPASSTYISKEYGSLENVDCLQKQKEIEMPKESTHGIWKNRRTSNENVRTFCIAREAEKRLERCSNLKSQDDELHKLRVEEMKFRVKTTEEEYENMKEKHVHEQAMRALKLKFMRDKLKQQSKQFENKHY